MIMLDFQDLYFPTTNACLPNEKPIMTLPDHYPRLRRTLPVRVVEAGVDLAAGVFFASTLAVPLAKVPMPFFVFGAPALETAPFLMTVALLLSLISLVALTRRPVLVAGREVGGLEDGVAAARRVLTGAAVVDELVPVLRVPAPRDDLAFSTKFDSMVVAAAVRDGPFRGDPGRAI